MLFEDNHCTQNPNAGQHVMHVSGWGGGGGGEVSKIAL